MHDRVVATVDLGSNSFHLLIAKVSGLEDIKVLCKKKQKVQLRLGVDNQGELDSTVGKKALACLARFATYIERYHVTHVKAVGTYSMRKIRTDHPFIEQANAALGHPIDIITGLQEAQLIYQGIVMAHDVKDTTLCIDIGGGSTEITLADEQEVHFTHSLEMGCVSMQQLFFKDQQLTQANFKAAHDYTVSVLEPWIDTLCQQAPPRQQVFGSSGTIQAIHNIIKAAGPIQMKSKGDTVFITYNHMQWVYDQLLEMKSIDHIQFKGLRKDRENILPGGLSILMALFKTLNIKQMQLSYSALREGLLAECMT